MKRMLFMFCSIILLTSSSSCKRCITCEYEVNDIKIESSFCASGVGAKKELDDFEKSLKEVGGENVKCKRDWN